MAGSKIRTARIKDLIALKHAAELLDSALDHGLDAGALAAAMELVKNAATKVKNGLSTVSVDKQVAKGHCPVDAGLFEPLPARLSQLQASSKPTDPKHSTPLENTHAKLNSEVTYKLVRSKLNAVGLRECRLR